MPLSHDIYVDSNTGDDKNDGTPEAPLRTLSRALDLRTAKIETTDFPVRIFKAIQTGLGRKWDEPFDDANGKQPPNTRTHHD